MSTQYEPNQLRGHADEADGIEEYDNKLPTWWVGLFAFCILWSIVIWFDWHIVTPRSIVAEWEADVAAHASTAEEAEVTLPAVVLTDEAISAGQALFASNCAACHGADGSGGIGVSLIDEEWVHGSSLTEIQHTIVVGVLDQGMPPWIAILGADGVTQVTAYVASIAGIDADAPAEGSAAAAVEPPAEGSAAAAD